MHAVFLYVKKLRQPKPFQPPEHIFQNGPPNVSQLRGKFKVEVPAFKGLEFRPIPFFCKCKTHTDRVRVPRAEGTLRLECAFFRVSDEREAGEE